MDRTTQFTSFQVSARLSGSRPACDGFTVAKMSILTGERIPGTSIARCSCREHADLVARALNLGMDEIIEELQALAGPIPDVCSECQEACSDRCDCWCHGRQG